MSQQQQQCRTRDDPLDAGKDCRAEGALAAEPEAARFCRIRWVGLDRDRWWRWRTVVFPQWQHLVRCNGGLLVGTVTQLEQLPGKLAAKLPLFDETSTTPQPSPPSSSFAAAAGHDIRGSITVSQSVSLVMLFCLLASFISDEANSQIVLQSLVEEVAATGTTALELSRNGSRRWGDNGEVREVTLLSFNFIASQSGASPHIMGKPSDEIKV